MVAVTLAVPLALLALVLMARALLQLPRGPTRHE